ncbi:MAG: DUF1045 domain-containing protein, partial [Sphingobium limneticum]
MWRKACAWLARDPATDREPIRPDIPGIDPSYAADITADARRYGFHATIKAPFHLAKGVTLEMLREAADSFAVARHAFDLPLRLAAIGRFLALV